MNHNTLRNAGLAGISALSLALVACGGSSSSSTPTTPTVVYNAPTIVNVKEPLKAVVAGHPAYDFTVYAQKGQTDDNLTVTATVPAGKGTVTVSGMNISYTPMATLTASEKVAMTVKVSNQFSKSSETVVNITVSPNTSPNFTNGGVITQVYTFGAAAPDQTLNMVATDLDGDTVTYEKGATPAWPSWVTLNTTTGLVTVKVKDVPAGDLGKALALTLMAKDGFGGTSTATLNLTVNAAAVVFNVTNVTQPASVVAGRTYPIDLKPRATSVDLYNNRFTAYCDYPVADTDELTWSFIYNGATVASQKTVGKNGAPTGAFVEFSPITIPLTDLGATRFYSVEVRDAKGNIARSNLYPVTPQANVLPVWNIANLVSTDFIRDTDGTNAGIATGVYPIVNVALTPVPAKTGTGMAMRFTVTATDANNDPLTFANARVVDAAAPATALKGSLVKIGNEVFDPATSKTTATYEFTPAFDDATLVPRFLVDFYDWAGATDPTKQTKDQAINNFDAAPNVLGAVRLNYPMEITAGYDETTAAAANLTTIVGAAGALVNTNLDPRAVKAEEGTINYGVKLASGSFATSNATSLPAAGVNVLIRDNNDISSLNGSFFNHDFLYAQAGSGKTLGGEVLTVTAEPALYGFGTASTSLTQDKTGRVKKTAPVWDVDGTYQLDWIAAHQDVRKPITFTASVKDFWGNQGPAFSWVGQMSSYVRPVKTDVVKTKAAFNAVTTGATKAWAATNTWTIQPYNRKAQADATTIASAENLKWASWGVGPGTWGNMGIFDAQGLYVPGEGESFTTELATTAWVGKVVTPGNLSSQIDAGNALPGVVAAGRYGVTLTPAAVVYERLFTNFRMDGDITDGMDLGVTVHGRDMAAAAAVAAVPGANTGFTISHVEGLRPWKPGSVLQFHNNNLSFGNIVLQTGDGQTAAYGAIAPVTATSKTIWSLPFPGLTNGNQIPAGVLAGGRFYLGSAFADDNGGLKPTPSTGTTTPMQVLLSGLSVPNVDLTVAGSLFNTSTGAGKTFDNLYLIQLDQVAGPAGLPMAAANRAAAPNNELVSANTLGTALANNIDWTGNGLINVSNGPTDPAPVGGNPGVTMTAATWNPKIDRGAFYTQALASAGTNKATPAVSYLTTRDGFTGGVTSKGAREQFALFASPSGFVRGFEQFSPMMLLAQDFYRTSNAAAGWAISTSQPVTDLGVQTFYHPFPAGYSLLAQYALQTGVTLTQPFGGVSIDPSAAPFSWGADYGFYANQVTISNTSDMTLAPVAAPVQNVKFSYTVAAAIPADYVDYVSYDISNRANLIGAPATTFQAAALDVDTILATTHGAVANTLANQAVGVPSVKLSWDVPAAFTEKYSGAEIEMWAYSAGANTFAAAPAATFGAIAAGDNGKPGLYKTYTVGKAYRDIRIPVTDITAAAGVSVNVFFRVRAIAMQNPNGTVADLNMTPLARTMATTNGVFGFAEFVTQPFVVTK